MTSSFRQRNITKPGGDTKKATDLENARRSWINEATGVNRDWKTIASNQAALAKYVDEAELADFKTTKKALDNFMQKTAVDATKMYWANEIAKGREAYETRDYDKNETYNKIKAEVEQLELDSEAKYREVQKRAEAAFLETEKEQIRKLSHFEKMGYARARLEEAAEGFGAWRLAELGSSEEWVQDKSGQWFQVKDYAKDGLVGGYEAASQHVYSKYYMENKGSFTSKYLTAKFIPKLNKTEQTQATTYYEQVRKEGLWDSIKANELNLMTVLKDKDSTQEQIEAALLTTHSVNRPLYNELGAKGGGNIAWRAGIMNQIKALAEADPAFANRDELIQTLKTWKVPGMNGKTMFDLYGEDGFSESYINNLFNSKAQEYARNLEKVNEKKREIVLNEARSAVRIHEENGTTISEDEKQALTDRIVDNGGTQKDISLLDQIINKKPTGELYDYNAAIEAAGADRQMTEAEFQVLDKKLIISSKVEQRLRDEGIISDDAFLQGGEIEGVAKSKDMLREAFRVRAGIDKVPGSKLGYQYDEALEYLWINGISGVGDPNIDTPGVVDLAKQYYKLSKQKTLPNGDPNLPDSEGNGGYNPNYTKAEALEQAANTVKTKWEALQTSGVVGSNHKLYHDGGFNNFNFGLSKQALSTQRNRNLAAIIQDGSAANPNSALEGILELTPTQLGLKDSDFDINLNTKDQPGMIFQMMAAADVSDTYDAWDFHNMFAKKMGREDLMVAKPTEAVLLRELITPGTLHWLYKHKGSQTLINQGLSPKAIGNRVRLNHVLKNSPLPPKEAYISPSGEAYPVTYIEGQGIISGANYMWLKSQI